MQRMPTPRRIWITACTGAGKSTLATQLAARLDLRHVELDALNWEAGWQAAPTAVFRERVAKALETPAWVVDGNYGVVSDLYLEQVEMVLWLDYGFVTNMLRLLKRTVRRVARREVLWQGNRESAWRTLSADSILWWLCKTYWKRKRDVPVLLDLLEARGVQVVRLRHPGEATRWLRALEADSGLNRDASRLSIPTTGDCR